MAASAWHRMQQMLCVLMMLASARALSVRTASQTLRTRLVDGYSRSGATGWTSAERAEIDSLIAQLAGARARYNERALRGGLWTVAYTSGERPRWQRDGSSNLAGQLYDLDNGRAVNYAEALGGRVRLVARGEVSEAEPSVKRCPKDFEVLITSASIQLGGLPRLTLPIRGPGRARVLYGDEGVRIFVAPNESPGRWEAEGLVVCQMPAATLLGASWTPPSELEAE